MTYKMEPTNYYLIVAVVIFINTMVIIGKSINIYLGYVRVSTDKQDNKKRQF